ncbi:MAG: PPOX class F420-dependent oxidoreductase [Actinobacteria bacterium]|nr:PPOX class F420-dependent oxidoreductase [Actinomycetota bacterium]
MTTPDDAREFIRSNHRAVLITRRKDGRVQGSPVTASVDGEGRVMISTRDASAKAKNLRRDPWATVLFMNDDFFGAWVQVEGAAEVVSLPDAMELLVEYYRDIAGEHPDWDEYRETMTEQGRVIVRIAIEGATGAL